MKPDCPECDSLLTAHADAMVDFQLRLDAYRADLAVVTRTSEIQVMREAIEYLQWRVDTTRDAFLTHEESHQPSAGSATAPVDSTTACMSS
jgi:hypothetical protein